MVSTGHHLKEKNREVSPDELEYRVNYNKLDRKAIFPLCIICFEDLSPKITLNRDLYPHPVLDVLICMECNNRYRKCNFESRKLCVCCGLPGKLKSCVKCPFYFCMKCLQSNLDKPVYDKVIVNEEWKCLICFSKPLWEQRAMCAKLISSTSNKKSSVTSLKRKRALSTNCQEMNKFKRKRSNSWGDKSPFSNVTDSREAVIKQLQQFALSNTIKKTPSEENYENAKKQLIQKADGFLLLASEVINRVSSFKAKITPQTFNEKVAQRAFSFEDELIGTTMKTLNLWKNELHEFCKTWYEDFNIVLCPPTTSSTNEELNSSVDKGTDQNEIHKKLTTKKSRNKFNLSLRRTSDSLTDEEPSVTPTDEEPSVTPTDDTKAVSPILLETENKVADIIQDNVNEDDEDSNGSLFSQATEKINSQDLVPVSADYNTAVVITECEGENTTLCHLIGGVSPNHNDAIIDDDAESDSSFVFDLSGYFSKPSSDHETEENPCGINNDSTLDNRDMNNSVRTESPKISCNSSITPFCDGTPQLEKDFLPGTDAQKASLNANCDDEPNSNRTKQHSDEIINTITQTSAQTDPCCSNGINEEESLVDGDQQGDDIFSQIGQGDTTSLQSATNKEEKVVDLQAKTDFLKALQLSSCKDELSIHEMDIDECISLKSYKSSIGEEQSDEYMESSDNADIKQALKLLDQDDSDIFLSDSDVSSNLEVLSESFEEDDDREILTDSFEKDTNKSISGGFIVDKLPDLRDSGDEPIISGTEYGIKPCWVFLERPTDAFKKLLKKLPKTVPGGDEKEIERLINLNNLDTKVNSKKVHKGHKINKSSDSSDTKSQSDESDSDSDSIIPSSLPNYDGNLDKSGGSPESISHEMSMITQEDMLDHLINGVIESDLEASVEDSDGNDEDNRPRKKKVKRATSTDSNKENKPVKEEINNDNEKISTDQPNTAEKETRSWMNDPLLRAKLSDVDSDLVSDSDAEGDNIISEKTRLKMEKLESRMLNRDSLVKPKVEHISPSKPKVDSDSGNDISLSSEDDISIIRHSPSKRIIIDTATDSDIEFISETKKKTPIKSKAQKPIRVGSDNSESESESNSSDSGSESESGGKKKGRRNIRAILSDETLEEATKRANLMEKQRKVRLTQKHMSMDSILSQSSQEEGLVLDIDDSKRPTIVVHPTLKKRLKKHQQAGVKFMWESCYEGVKQLQRDSGSGCILAHCMGLGKTFQVIALIHTLFANKITQTKHVLVVCPLSIVLNWENEFKNCLEGLNDNVVVNTFCLTDRYSSPKQKLFLVEKWRQKKGVLIMGYEAYQRLTMVQNPEKLTVRERNIMKTLVDPGPDLVVLDEGHLLKNGKNVRSKALMKMKTRRRIVLTGTPLQNNLTEYYYMVQFVKPNLLGSYREYTNRFVNPIMNGQYDDSTVHDIAQMKKRSHVLHKSLEGTIQRYEVSELKSYLPEKYDYVLFIQLHPVQAQLYEKYLELLQPGGDIVPKHKLFSIYHQLQFIWTHPYLLYLKEQGVSSSNKNNNKIQTENNPDAYNEEESVTDANEVTESTGIAKGWWNPLCPEDYKTNISYGPKFKVMLSIIRESEKVGDKVLVFSNSIRELNAIELFLQKNEMPNSQWIPKKDYCRIDGSIQSEARLKLCNSFNNKNNKRTRVFLISRGVGGLGLNLVAANRVIVMDVSWNPASDSQSVFRIYRFGQEKKCYIYRLVSMGTMEEVVYERQVTKLAIAGRVVDEMQISRHYKSNDLRLSRFNYNIDQERPPLHVPIDTVLATVLQNCKDIFKYHEHQTLLENMPEEELNEDEMKLAWDEFNKENERRLVEQQKKKTAPQPGPSGVNSFLPSNNSNNVVQGTTNNNGLDPQPINANSSISVPNTFESIFIPDYSRNNFTTENTALLRNNKVQNQNFAAIDLVYNQWLQQQNSGATSNMNIPQNMKTSKPAQMTLPPVFATAKAKSTPYQNKNTISKRTSWKSSSNQNSTFKIPVITSVSGSATAQSNISTATKITDLTGDSTTKDNVPITSIISNVTGSSTIQNYILVPKISNVTDLTGDSTTQNNIPMTSIISNVAGSSTIQNYAVIPKISNAGVFTVPKDGIFMPRITNVTGGSGALPFGSSTPKLPNKKQTAQTSLRQDVTPRLPKIVNVVGASTSKNNGPIVNKIAMAGQTPITRPLSYKGKNNITLTKINKASKEKRSSMVMNPVNSSNAITLTKQNKSTEADTRNDVVNIQDEIRRNKTVLQNNEHHELVRALKKNIGITLLPLDKQPIDISNRDPSRNSTSQSNDVIEID